VKTNEVSYLRDKNVCQSSETVVSGDIRLMRIFARVYTRAKKRQLTVGGQRRPIFNATSRIVFRTFRN